jgi:hypothetical protein
LRSGNAAKSRRFDGGRKPAAGIWTRWLGFLVFAVAAAAVVLVPAAVDFGVVVADPGMAYHPAKFGVFMRLSAALVVFALAFLLVDRESPLRVPVLIPVLTFLGVAALSTILSGNARHSLLGDRHEGLLSMAAGALLFYATARSLNTPARVRSLLAAMVAAAAAISAIGLLQAVGIGLISGWGNPPFADLGRTFATLGNPITFAAYLTLAMGAAAALSFEAGRWGRVLWLSSLALLSACWIYTDTRGAMLGLGLTLPIALPLAYHKMGTLQPLLPPLATLVAAMVAAATIAEAVGNPDLSSRVAGAFLAYLIFVTLVVWASARWPGSSRALLAALVVFTVAGTAVAAAGVASGNLGSSGRAEGARDGELSTQIRLYIWRETVSMILDRPLLGHGPDNFAEPFRPYAGEDLQGAIGNDDGRGRTLRVDRAHNDLLQVAATTGLLGLAAYLWIFVSFFRHAYRHGGWPLLALAGAVLAYALQLQTAFPSIATSVVFWGILGTSVAMMRASAEDVVPPAPGDTGRGVARNAFAGKGVYELATVAVVLGVLAAIAFPAFASQREKAAEAAQLRLKLDVIQTALYYDKREEAGRDYPRAGVYTREDPLRTGRGTVKLRPAPGTSIATDIPTPTTFTVEGRSSTLSGTFYYSYDSATGEYSESP